MEKPCFGKKINETKKNILSKKEYDFIGSEILRLLDKDIKSVLTKEDELYLEKISKKIVVKIQKDYSASYSKPIIFLVGNSVLIFLVLFLPSNKYSISNRNKLYK